MELEKIVIAVVSFLIGSIPFGYLIAKIKGVDIRNEGSGNIGATNVYRVLGKKYGALTLLLDLSKGLFCVLAARFIFKGDVYAVYIAVVFVMLGHDFSLFLKFKGGKGVATTYGALLPVSFIAAVSGMILWLAVLLTTKYSSLAALLSFGVATAVCFLLKENPGNRYVFLFLFILMLFKHRENLKRFYLKKENRLNI